MYVDDAHEQADTLVIMRAALAYKPEHDEVSVSSTEVLESNVVAIRDQFKEFRTEVRVSLARLDHKIESAVTTLREEIGAMAAKAASDLKDLATRIEGQLGEMRQDMREMRAEQKVLRDKIDGTNARIDGTNARIDDTNAKIDAINAKLTELGTRLGALFWVIGGSITLGTFVITVGKAFGWF